MAIPKMVKVLLGFNDEGTPGADIVRSIYYAIAEKYGDQVRQAILDEDEREGHFIAVTDCGWWRLDFIAWSVGHPGVSRYILRMRDIDDPETERYYAELLDRL